MTRPVADSLTRLERWLAQHRPRYHQALLPGASAAELDDLQKKLGVPLPAELRVLLGWHNGQAESAGAFAESWLLMSAAAIAAAKPELDAGAAATGWQPALIPFLDDDQGDYLCLDSNQSTSQVCPDCGAPVKLRQSVRGYFLGCSRYPSCRHCRNVSPTAIESWGLTPVRSFWFGKKEHALVFPSLAAWLGEFVGAVERGEYVEDSERGHFLLRSGS
jgi:hypothetical protein